MTITDRPAPPTSAVKVPWLPMGVLMAATIMVALDGTIVNVALHEIGIDLGAGAGIEWIVTAYLLAVCAVQPATGWLSDRFGRRQVFLVSLVVFTVASALCALAPSLPFLIAARVAQGLGGGAIMPIGMATGMELVAPEGRGRVMAIWGMSSMAAPAIGPTVGGWLVTSVGWHWLFFINLPIGVATAIAGYRLLPETGHRERRPFDLPGLLLGSAGLAVFVLGVGQGSGWGWSAPVTLVCLVGGGASLIAFVFHELSTPDPLIDLRMFGERSFKLAVSVIMITTGVSYGRMVFFPLMLQELRGYDAFDVGLVLIAPAVAGAVAMRIGGALVDAGGPRRPIVIGCTGMFLSLVPMTQIRLDTPVAVIIAGLCAMAFSWGLTTSPSFVAGLSQLPPRLLSQGSAVRSLAGQVAGAVFVAVYAAVLSVRMGDAPSPERAQSAFDFLNVLSAVAVLAAIGFASRLPRGRIVANGQTMPVDLAE